MSYAPFNVLLNSVCQDIVEDFRTYIHQGCWPVLLFKLRVFINVLLELSASINLL